MLVMSSLLTLPEQEHMCAHPSIEFAVDPRLSFTSAQRDKHPLSTNKKIKKVKRRMLVFRHKITLLWKTFLLFFLLTLLINPFAESIALMNDFSLPLEALANTATSYASAHGVQVEKKHKDDPERSYFECAPISLLPNAYPASAFVQAQIVAPAFNLLVDNISRRPDFLEETLRGVVTADPYTKKLLDLYNTIYVNKETQSKFALSADRLGIHRSDYMLHQEQSDGPYVIKQVELNTIAASFACLSTRVASLHRHLEQRYATDLVDFMTTNKGAVLAQAVTTPSLSDTDGVPENPALKRLAYAMKVTYERYQSRFRNSDNKLPLVILFVVQEGESNTVDQRLLEFQVWEDFQIPIVRRSLTQLSKMTSVDESTGALLIENGTMEVALVYFRAGYAPTDYPDGNDGVEWQARALLETSRATKCPSLGYHLAGTKKVQQALARPGVLEDIYKDTKDSDAITNMRNAFAGLYALGNDATDEDFEAVKDVISRGQQARYVLKPQREGGGYNFYGDKLLEKLQENIKIQDDGSLQLGPKLSEYILMERLFPPTQKAILLRSGRIEGTGDSISELGCFGTILVSSEGENVLHNEYGM
jgi:glutathione synthase